MQKYAFKNKGETSFKFLIILGVSESIFVLGIKIKMDD